MNSAKYMHLLLLSSLMMMMGGCEFRDVLDDYPVSGVEIKLNWMGVTDKLPETMRVIFYPKDEEGHRIESYLSPVGGEVKVPPGRYSMVIYNFDTECVKVQGESSYETLQAVALPCPESISSEAALWSPDALYVVALDDVEIAKSDEPVQLEFKPENAVRRYSFEIKVRGLKNVADVICNVKGLNGSYFLGMNSCRTSELPLHVEINRGEGVLKGLFSGFLMTKREYSYPVLSRADAEILMTLKLVKLDKTVQEVKVDITKVVAPPTGGDVEEPDEPAADVEIEIPLEEDIVVEDVKPEPGGNGGIGGDVGDWDDETDVVL